MTRRLTKLAAVVAVLMAVLTAPPASASSSVATTDGPTFTISATRRMPGLGFAAGSVITCTFKVNYPHHSSHNIGSINATSSISCTSPVAALDISMKLIYQGTTKGTGHNSNEGKSWISTNAAYPGCIAGNWKATAHDWVLFPPGYIPTTDSGDVDSGYRSITCD